eukprot:1362027-Prymnesium_polylepis.1
MTEELTSVPADFASAADIYEAGGNLSLRGLSQTARVLMFDCSAGCPQKYFEMYFDYYGCTLAAASIEMFLDRAWPGLSPCVSLPPQ